MREHCDVRNKQTLKSEKTRQQMLDLLDGDRKMLQSLTDEELSKLTGDITPPVPKTSRFLVLTFIQKRWFALEKKQKEAYVSRHLVAYQKLGGYHLQGDNIEGSSLY